jgi:hypothetical protein
MNVISYLNGEAQITDKSTCVCPTIRLIAIWLNDFADDELRQRMVPFILRAFGSATDNKVEMERRLKAVVKYAEFNARLAAYFAKSAGYAGYAVEYAKSAVGYAQSAVGYAQSAAESAAKSAQYAAQYAKSAGYAAKSAQYAAQYAVESAVESAVGYAQSAAESAAKSAGYAAQYAKSAGYAAMKEASFQAGLDFLDEVCPPLEALDKVILSRVTELQKLNEAMPTTEEVK